jgi:hypothetical protein
VKLRYTGLHTVTFLTANVGEVSPGAEFTVPDELVESFIHRADIEEVVEVEALPVSKKKPPTTIGVVVDGLSEIGATEPQKEASSDS